MIKQINFGSNTAFSLSYMIMKNKPENRLIPLSNALPVPVDKIVRDYPVIEIDEETGEETLISTPTVEQVMEAINPNSLTEIFVKDDVQYLKLCLPVKQRRDDDGFSTMDQLQGILKAMSTGETVKWTGNIYNEIEYNQLLLPYSEYDNPDGMGGWDEIIRL